MSKFEYGDEIDKHIVKVIVHEFSRCRFAFDSFIQCKPRNEKELKHASINKVLVAYNSYALFIQHLYEYFLACIKRDNLNTKNIDSDAADALINLEVNKILRNWRLGIDKGFAPPWSNDRSYYEGECPEEFGKDFRNIRNSLSHADIRRVYGGNRITLTEFHNKYHKYIYMLYENAQGLWSIEKLKEVELGDVTSFYHSIFKTN